MLVKLFLSVLSLPIGSLAFTISRNHRHDRCCVPTFTFTSASFEFTLRSASIITDLEIAPQDEPNQNQAQLWLDLRTTSIPPQTALLHLTNDLWEEYVPPSNKSFIVDKVLINNSPNLKTIIADIREEYETEIGILVAEGEDIFEIDEAGSMRSTATGTIISLERDDNGLITLNINPLPVLDVVSKGDWVMLDVNDYIEAGDVSNLIELVSNGAAAFGALGVGAGADIGADVDADIITSITTDGPLASLGGIGISCSSQADVVEIGALIHSLSGSKGYKATANGILVQNGDNIPGNNSSSESIGYAIVMPFDAQLWKTSSFIFGNAED